MGDKSKIEWTESTLNVITGCTKVSAGCKNCYAEKVFHWVYPGRDFGDIQFHENRLGHPLKWKKPRRIFVNSLSDLFHESIPDEWIDKVFAMMAATQRHQYQILTKRPERMHKYIVLRGMDARTMGADEPITLPNVWLGVSAEDQKTADQRIPILLDTPAAVRFVSAEPLLGAVDLTSWLGANYNPQHGDETQGRAGLSVSAGRHVSHRLRRAHMAAQPPSRAQDRQVFSGQGDAERDSASRSGSQVGMAALQRPDSGSPSDKPQERQRSGQSTGESGVGDGIGEHSALYPLSEARKHSSPERRIQPYEQVDRDAGSHHSQTPIQRTISETDRGEIRRDLPDDLKDRPRPTLDWIICGGESGPGARPMELAWAQDIVGKCLYAGVPVFVKQVGSLPITSGGLTWEKKDRKGGDPSEWPKSLRVRQFPKVKTT